MDKLLVRNVVSIHIPLLGVQVIEKLKIKVTIIEFSPIFINLQGIVTSTWGNFYFLFLFLFLFSPFPKLKCDLIQSRQAQNFTRP